MALATSITEVPAAKQLKSGFGAGPSWGSVMQKQALQQKTPHRYQQSPVFPRKAETPNSSETHEHSKHHHHRHHRRHHNHHRRRGNSEGDKTEVTPEERVHLLSELPWRKSGDFSSANYCSSEEVSTPSVPRINVPAVSPTLPRRYDNAPNFQQRERTYSMPTGKRPVFTRRGKQRARSQDSSPATQRRGFLQLPLLIPQSQFAGSVVIGIQNFVDSASNQSALTPETPLADSNGFLKVPTIDSLPSQDSHVFQRFLGLQTDVDENYKGLTDEEIKRSSLMVRRGSSSSESSTSTLT